MRFCVDCKRYQSKYEPAHTENFKNVSPRVLAFAIAEAMRDQGENPRAYKWRQARQWAHMHTDAVNEALFFVELLGGNVALERKVRSALKERYARD